MIARSNDPGSWSGYVVRGSYATGSSVKRGYAADGVASGPIAAPASRAAEPPGGDGGVLAFVPAAGPFPIQFDVPPDSGTITIIGDTGTRATVERLGGGRQELLVTPRGLRVRNAGRGSASYVVRVPSVLERITVRLGARSPDVLVDVRRDSRRVLTFRRR